MECQEVNNPGGSSTQQRRMAELPLGDIQRLYEAGKGIKAIGRELGVSKMRVRSALLYLGIYQRYKTGGWNKGLKPVVGDANCERWYSEGASKLLRMREKRRKNVGWRGLPLFYESKEKREERQREYARKQYWANPEKYKQNSKLWWRQATPEQKEAKKIHLKRWRKRNPHSRRVESNQRRTTTKIRQNAIAKLMERQRGKCVYCKTGIRESFHLDHIVPVSKGGSGGVANLQLLCPGCNHDKKDKDPVEYANEIGLLV